MEMLLEPSQAPNEWPVEASRQERMGEHTDLRLTKDKDASAHKKEGGGPIVHTSNG